MHLEEWEKILETLQESYQVAKENGNLQEQADSLDRFYQALHLAEELGGKLEQAKYHLALAEIFKQGGNFALSLSHFEQYHSLKEAIRKEEIDKQLESLFANQDADSALEKIYLYQERNQILQEEIQVRELAEKSLQELNQNLHTEIQEKERLIHDLNAFAHMVAHDLKNPLSAITGYAYLLNSRLESTQDIQILRYLAIIEQTSQRMSRIIDEILLLASVRDQDVIPLPIDMEIIIQEVQERLSHMINQYEATLVFPPTWPLVLGHRSWIEEVWINYITNAIKYGGAPPHIQLGATLQTDGMARFWVQDNGAGLSLEEQSRLFKEFERLEISKIEGHGLGISIVKRIVEKLNGKVSVTSEGVPGKGCIFSFTLPAVQDSTT